MADKDDMQANHKPYQCDVKLKWEKNGKYKINKWGLFRINEKNRRQINRYDIVRFAIWNNGV